MSIFHVSLRVPSLGIAPRPSVLQTDVQTIYTKTAWARIKSITKNFLSSRYVMSGCEPEKYLINIFNQVFYVIVIYTPASVGMKGVEPFFYGRKP